MKVLVVANNSWNLYHFRLELLQALRDKGLEVILVCSPDSFISKLSDEGFNIIPWCIERGSLNFFKELRALLKLLQIYKREKPEIVHHFTIKPNFYGSLAARFVNISYIINTWTGLGYLFSDAFLAKVVRYILGPIMRIAFRQSGIVNVCQNLTDKEYLIRSGLSHHNRIRVIFGSGVDLEKFHPIEINKKSEPPIVFIASRLLWDKGIFEVVEAAKILYKRGFRARFWIAGDVDPSNPKSITKEKIMKCQNKGYIEFLGFRNDIDSLLKKASLAVFPSYYFEGVPLFLIEACASGVPIVASDTPGCRIVVEHGVNGFLVSPKNSEALADAIERILTNQELYVRMGFNGRLKAEKEFDRRLIVERYLELYRSLGIFN